MRDRGHFSKEDRRAIQAEIFERIGSLTRLKTLYMFSHSDLRGNGSYGVLNFVLGCGLNCLKDLRQLESVDFSLTHQQVSEREIQWMLSNWPRLALLPGMLHPLEADFKGVVRPPWSVAEWQTEPGL